MIDLKEIIQTGNKTSIPGVELKHLKTYPDGFGFFREVLRVGDLMPVGFGQWSHSVKHTGVIKAWHIHQLQTDYWYVPIGAMLAVLCDRRPGANGEIEEYLLGEYYEPVVLKIPPGVAHGFKVLQGPCHLLYVTTKTYDPADEGRIPYTAIDYDWFKQVVK